MLRKLWNPAAGDYCLVRGIVELRVSAKQRMPHALWLPRADQLFELMLNHYMTKNPAYVINRFHYFLLNQTPARDVATLEQLLIHFVMHEKFGRRMLGTEWVSLVKI